VPFFEGIANQCEGVFDTLNTLSRMVLLREFGQVQEGAS